MGSIISQLVVDSADPERLGRWWAEVLGWELTLDDEDEVWVAPHADDLTGGLLFITVPDAKTVKNRLHLDLRPPDGSSQEEELERLLRLGATTVDVGQRDATWHVLADPEGNEFCLLRNSPAQLAAVVAAERAEAERAEAERTEAPSTAVRGSAEV
ncbi:VOC family protein [Actinotalea ferrariae]|uniref:VOC family protein n=1 Tax=Actinotalea ferrariae TaxID=1386098 RepID=UPI001C8BDFCF|nr:VOC family protein [Actinotalea ferrariae]MBX9244583.1 VOC family protein [Actinotalea ferrariae]